MCHQRTHDHTAASFGCGVSSHSSFHASNPSHNSCSNSATNFFAFQQTNLGISLVRHVVPRLCCQRCVWNTGPRRH